MTLEKFDYISILPTRKGDLLNEKLEGLREYKVVKEYKEKIDI